MKQSVRKCAVWEGPEDVRLTERAMPSLEANDLLVQVESCAICGSDLRIFKYGNARVTAGTIVGHEIAGKIVEIGKSGTSSFRVGDRVAIGADIPCGKCAHCLAGRSNCCEINYAVGHQFEGGFTEYMRVNALTASLGPVHKIRDTTDYDVAALAEPLACCINGYERGLMTPGRSVIIFGAGAIGMMLALLAPTYGASQVIMIDPQQNRLDKAVQLGLAAHVINPAKENVISAVMELTAGLGADMIFTACPSVETHEQALKIIAKRGVINLFGGVPKTEPPIYVSSNFIHYREAYITGSHGSTPEQHRQALALIESGKVDVKPLVTHHYPLTEIRDAYAMAASGAAIKVIVKPHAHA